MIPYGRQDISIEDIDAVVSVLKSDFLTQGPTVPAFEQLIADYCNANYAVAVNSATSALHIACLALGVKKGDIVWTSPITFVASRKTVPCIVVQMWILWTLILQHIICLLVFWKKSLLKQRSKVVYPKVVIPVHLAGQSCDE